MVTRLIAKGASVLATDRDGRDALEYLQLSVQQQHQRLPHSNSISYPLIYPSRFSNTLPRNTLTLLTD